MSRAQTLSRLAVGATFNGTAVQVPDLNDASLTANRVVFAAASGNLQTSSNLAFDGTNLGVGTTSTFGNSTVSAVLGFVARNSGATQGYFQTHNANAGTDLKTWRFGGNNSGALTFETVNDAYSAATGRMTLDSAGRLGIGVTSPGKRLEVVSNPDTAAPTVGALFFINNPGLTPAQINSTSTGMGANGIVENFAGDSHYRSFWGFSIDKGAGGLSSGATNTVNPDSRSFAIRQFVSGTTWNTQFLVNGAGDVGIGTTTPNAAIHVVRNDGAVGIRATAGEAHAARVLLQTGGGVFSIGTVANENGQGITFTQEGVSERVRINSSGFMGIGTSNPVGRLHVTNSFVVESGTNVLVLYNSGARPDNSTGYRLNESYGAQWVGSSSTRIWHSSFINSSILVGLSPTGADFGNGNGYFTGTVSQNYSDIRLKNDLGTIDNALDKVMQLRGFRYTINGLGQELGFNDNGVEAGLSAQDVQAVLPEAVMLAGVDMAPGENGEVISKSGENYLTLRYDRVVPLLVNAIKEQQAIIDQLKARLDAANL